MLKNKISKKVIKKNLESKFADVSSYLNIIPEKRDKILSRLKEFLKLEPVDYKHYFHLLRCGLYSAMLADYLGIKEEYWRKTMFEGYSLHDIGAIKPAKKGINGADIRNPHVEYQNIKGLIKNPDCIYMAMAHHKYRKDSYPEEIPFNTTPERIFLTQRLGVIDFFDAASSRVNSKTTLSEEDKINNRIIPSKETIKTLLIEEYGREDFSYSGKVFHKTKETGEEFIERMYSEGLFSYQHKDLPINYVHFED